MKRSLILPGILVVALGVALATQLWAYPEVAAKTKLGCATCHANPAGGAALTDAGKAFKADGKAPAAGTAKNAEYVGVAKCKMCHMKQHKGWLETAHAKSWATLASGDAKKNADFAAALKVELKGAPSASDDCVRCHVTGFKLAGGYPQADSTKAANVANVTCEGCHGPGSLHVAAPKAEKKNFITKPGENMCKACHTAAASPKFVFADYAKRGVHVVPAAAK